MERSVINDANAPNPIGSYNQAVVANGFVFTAGQIAIDPSNGELVDGSFKDRVDQVFKNLSAILERAGTDLSKVVKFTVFLTDMSHYSDVNDVFNKWLDEDNAPARSLVAVKGLPAGTDVEIECVALV
ncbi:MAG: Rid family detoxifying hydrolase [Candidatus Neomarinimicrobiota bacterium]|jgi:2-iminobutanoate/2-iminopropanoate deaminase|nr:Rid family detoxifying hydrolase [Candidatus Neomarinimicrobiota bacterium]|tara:strand:+ start:177 stop:560 length:384 start_codon:yes stop_codon:yes gene_type:complete